MRRDLKHSGNGPSWCALAIAAALCGVLACLGGAGATLDPRRDCSRADARTLVIEVYLSESGDLSLAGRPAALDEVRTAILAEPGAGVVLTVHPEASNASFLRTLDTIGAAARCGTAVVQRPLEAADRPSTGAPAQ
jgi:hypothetical protein